MTRQTLWRPIAAALLIVAALVALRGMTPAAALQDATPAPSYSCDDASPPPSTPMAGMEGMGTPTAEMDMSDMDMEIDVVYIDMMIPHHESIVALSEAALPRLTDKRLRTIAQAIIDAQTAEVAELRGYREQLYGSPDTAPMDDTSMEMMSTMMPGMGSTEEMAFQMDAESQVSAFCAAEDPDLAFIDLVIPHHEMAITASETAVEEAVNAEIVAFAERVIVDQQREIEELTAIRAELTGEATPTA